MFQVPEVLFNEIKKFLFDFDHFEYVLLNGGLVGLIGIPLIIYFLREIIIEYRKNEN